jgi:ribose transport system substrate-binding protein
MLMALVSIRQAGKISFVGFDSSDIYIDRLRSRFIRGLVVQNPLRIGELGVKTLVEHIHGVSVSRRVDTGATMVTPDNMDEHEIRQLLNPQIA